MSILEYGVNERMPGGAGHNPFDKNFETRDLAVQAGKEYLIDNPEVKSVDIFSITIVDQQIIADRTLETIDRSDISRERGRKMDYTVFIEVQVTANCAHEAANFALDDLRDDNLGPWDVQVSNSHGVKTVVQAGKNCEAQTLVTTARQRE